MFRVGFGMNLPPAKVQNPAAIAIFKAPNADPDVFFNDQQISSKLAKVGHRVSLVSPETPASDAPQAFNVVIARADEVERARETLGSLAARATFLPVYEGLNTAKGDQNLSLPSSATLRQILAVVQQVLTAIPS